MQLPVPKALTDALIPLHIHTSKMRAMHPTSIQTSQCGLVSEGVSVCSLNSRDLESGIPSLLLRPKGDATDIYTTSYSFGITRARDVCRKEQDRDGQITKQVGIQNGDGA